MPVYRRLECERDRIPTLGNESVQRALSVLLNCADGFAAQCRVDPTHERDPSRTGHLLCAVGLGVDEASGFLRAIDEDLVRLNSDGNFQIPGARACSPNLHVVGREGDGVKLHTEVLIHLTSYAELVLDHGWVPSRIVFDPFFGSDALDLWGYSGPPSSDSWRAGDVVFAAEAKARIEGADGLKSLVRAFDKLAVAASGKNCVSWQNVRSSFFS